jgi:tetratricopeptide (TPR) repeat protein
MKIFKKLSKNNNLFDRYVTLGVIQSELKFYKKALLYYERSRDSSLISENKNKLSLNNNNNNIGLVYLEKGNYNKAISLCKKDLTPNLKK